MMGDFEDAGDDLVDTDSFLSHRGAGEEAYYVPDDSDSNSDSSEDMNELDLEWSHGDLRALMDELDEMDQFSVDDEKDYDIIIEDVDEDGANEDRPAEWYSHPYERNFVQDFRCLQNSSYNIRKDLLDMLEVPERPSDDRSDAGVDDQFLHDEVMEAINDILTPGMSREGLKTLHNIVLREPTLNLKNYLEDADPYALAYIIWGLNFYINRHVKDEWKKNLPRIIECGTQASTSDLLQKEENLSVSNMIFTLGLRLLSWFCDLIKRINISGYEEILRQIFPLTGDMRTDNEVEFMHAR